MEYLHPDVPGRIQRIELVTVNNPAAIGYKIYFSFNVGQDNLRGSVVVDEGQMAQRRFTEGAGVGVRVFLPAPRWAAVMSTQMKSEAGVIGEWVCAAAVCVFGVFAFYLVWGGIVYESRLVRLGIEEMGQVAKKEGRSCAFGGIRYIVTFRFSGGLFEMEVWPKEFLMTDVGAAVKVLSLSGGREEMAIIYDFCAVCCPDSRVRV